MYTYVFSVFSNVIFLFERFRPWPESKKYLLLKYSSSQQTNARAVWYEEMLYNVIHVKVLSFQQMRDF